MKEPVKKKSSSPRAARTKKEPKKESKNESISFEYFDPSAHSVAVVGDFNQWNPESKPMKREEGGLWKVKVSLAPGTYQYKFVVNGERWEEDPLNLQRVMNEHGSYNSIRNVGVNADGNLGPTA
ncbi:MAG: isoamylase early set domain-containing protein [Nitrospira sp.]